MQRVGRKLPSAGGLPQKLYWPEVGLGEAGS